MNGVLIYAIVVVFMFGGIACLIYMHGPYLKAKNKKIEKIKENGFIHITSKECATKIINSGTLIGFKSNIGFPETLCGKLIWVFENKEIEEKLKWLNNKVRAKDGRKIYDTCLLLDNISKEDLKRLYRVPGYGMKGIYAFRKGDIKPGKIDIVNI